MWLLPKNHPLYSAFAQDSYEDLKLELSTHYGLNSPLPLMRKSKPLSLKTFYAGWKRVFWIRHLSGRILKLSLSNYFGAKYTASLEGIHASRFQLPVIKKDQKTQDTYGPTLKKVSQQLDLFSVSSKTSKDTLTLDMNKSEESFKNLVTRLGKESIQRKKLARHTEEIGSSYLQLESEEDPKKFQDRMKKYDNRTLIPNLSTRVKQWGTPRVTTNGGNGKAERSDKCRIEDQVHKWQTPQARDFRSPDLPESGNYQRKKGDLVYVRDTENELWEMRYYSHKKDNVHYCFNNQQKNNSCTDWAILSLENPLLKEKE